MEQTASKASWKSWSGFLTWAQNFSLKKKVLGGFLGVAILVGLLTSFIGTQLARDMIIERAQTRVRDDLGTAEYILKHSVDTLDLKVRFAADTDKLRGLVEAGAVPELRVFLKKLAVDNHLDFLTLTNAAGTVIADAFSKEPTPLQFKDPLIAMAVGGQNHTSLRVVPTQELVKRNQETAKLIQDKANNVLVMEAAYPVVSGNRVVGALLGGDLVPVKHPLPAPVSQRLLGEAGSGEEGFITIFVGEQAVSSTLRDANGNAYLPKADETIRLGPLTRGNVEVTSAMYQGARYFTAVGPIKDAWGNIIGAMEIGALAKPIIGVIERLVTTFLLVGLFGVLLMAAISYFLVTWINRPLEQMLNSARRAAEGDLSHEVPVMATDEVGELAATFNLMIRNLAEAKRRQEEYGKQLATKVAAQMGELDQAREQVARVKKLASLEKMADGMAHIMAHISDPMLRSYTPDEEGATSSILVMDSEEKVLEICQRIFESEGFNVKLTRTVNQALDELEKEFYDVIITEIDTPGFTGMELLKEIKYRQPDIVVILTAPFRSTAAAEDTVKLGAFDYIPKPFGPHQILLTVYTALQSRQILTRTRKQHADQRAETIFQQLPVAIALADASNRIVYHNQAFIDLAGVDGDQVNGKTFSELFGIEPFSSARGDDSGPRWLQLEKVGRTAKLYNFDLKEEKLRVLMLLDITESVMKEQEVDVLKAETISKAQQVIHQQMRVAQEIAGLLGETTAETKAALFELIKLARKGVG